MSFARHPIWLRVKQHIYHPTWKAKLIDFVVRMFICSAIYFLTSSILLFVMSLFVTAMLPSVVVGLLDIYLRIQFSLAALLTAILTLQIPIAILITAESGFGIAMGAASLLFWVFLLGLYIQVQLPIEEDTNMGRRWKQIEPEETVPPDTKNQDA